MGRYKQKQDRGDGMGWSGIPLGTGVRVVDTGRQCLGCRCGGNLGVLQDL